MAAASSDGAIKSLRFGSFCSGNGVPPRLRCSPIRRRKEVGSAPAGGMPPGFRSCGATHKGRLEMEGASGIRTSFGARVAKGHAPDSPCSGARGPHAADPSSKGIHAQDLQRRRQAALLVT